MDIVSEAAMNTSAEKPRRWVLVAVGIAVLLLLLLVGFLWRGDDAARQAVAQVHPGMTVEEVRQILRPVCGVVRSMPLGGGEEGFMFYSVDELVLVYLDRERTTVTRIEHEPDDGPLWERLRRRWENRFRRWGHRFRP
jgi:hypothetical protein